MWCSHWGVLMTDFKKEAKECFQDSYWAFDKKIYLRIESALIKADAEAFKRGMEEGARIADHQATICGSSLSRQSTSHDIASNIRRQIKS